MSDVVIQARNLSKLYHIGEREPYLALRDVLARWLRAPTKRLGRTEPRRDSDSNELWALRNVSFEVCRGDVMGVLGHNGAGKSTLLKILARVTKPSCGFATLRGRMGTLLEVGTGFHPELTGRENVFLSGAILGMRKHEIHRKFDEIVAFSEVERFIDTPLKHYSSGMQMRLAFSVAAHLEPEILLVDEVLAVGDMSFQKKCLGKMKEVSKGGRTVLFVSHNMSAVRALCTRALVLQDGKVFCDCVDPLQAITLYARSGRAPTREWVRSSRDDSSAPMVFRSIVADVLGDQPNHKLRVSVELDSREPHAPAFVAFDILDSASVPIMQALPSLHPFLPYCTTPQRVQVVIDLPPLIPDTYQVTAWVGQHNTLTYDLVQSAVCFDILTSPTHGRSVPHTRDHGHIVPNSIFTVLDLNARASP